MPTSEWNAATSSGIDVIGTRRAITAPIEPPIATPSTTNNQPMPSAGGCAASVVATAIPMPIMPKKLPCRDEAGLDKPRSDKMNRTPATRYKTAARLAFIDEPPPLSSSAKADDPVTRNRRDLTNRHCVLDAPPEPVVGLAAGETRWRGMTTAFCESARRSPDLLFVHREHALGDQEAAKDIHAGKDQRNEAKAARPDPAAANHGDADREQRADHDHRGDRVGHRHQRRMQCGGHRPHHEIPDEHGKHEDRQPEHEGIDDLGNMIHGGSPV